MTEKQLNGKISALPQHIQAVVTRSLNKRKKQILDLNKGQLLAGEDSMGKEFGDYKSASWVRKRKKKGLQIGHIDLKFDGNFQKNMFVDISGAGIKIGSKDDKTEQLVHHWGDDIFGLSQENLDALTEEIATDLANDLKTYFT